MRSATRPPPLTPRMHSFIQCSVLITAGSPGVAVSQSPTSSVESATT